MTVLDEIVAVKKQEIQALYKHTGIETLQSNAETFSHRSGRFVQALSASGLSLIAEIKKASPSKGIIRDPFDPEALYDEFVSAGAAALSVLTDETFFQGHLSILSRLSQKGETPLLRKEFILDPIQVYEAKVAGADAILLIKAILENETAQLLLDTAHSVGLDVLMELHNEDEFSEIQSLKGLRCIGINNRDLRTFDVDTMTSVRLKNLIRERYGREMLVVAESGYQSVEDLKGLESEGFDAVLIGEGLASCPDMLHYIKTRGIIEEKQ